MQINKHNTLLYVSSWGGEFVIFDLLTKEKLGELP